MLAPSIDLLEIMLFQILFLTAQKELIEDNKIKTISKIKKFKLRIELKLYLKNKKILAIKI